MDREIRTRRERDDHGIVWRWMRRWNVTLCALVLLVEAGACTLTNSLDELGGAHAGGSASDASAGSGGGAGADGSGGTSGADGSAGAAGSGGSAGTAGVGCVGAAPLMEAGASFCGPGDCLCPDLMQCFAVAAAACCNTQSACGLDAGIDAASCGGVHPLVAGNLRYCEPGSCYCTSADQCFVQSTAAACCGESVVCY